MKCHARVRKNLAITQNTYEMIYYNLLDSNVHYKHTTSCNVNANIKFKMKKGFHVIYCLVTCNLKIWNDIQERFLNIFIFEHKHMIMD